jgi:subtilisin family serine protease
MYFMTGRTMQSLTQETNSISSTSNDRFGCGTIAAIVALTIIVLAATGTALFASWTLEQTIFEGSLGVPDLRWLISLIYGIVICLPTGLAAIFLSPSRIKSMMRIWAIAGLFSLFLIPARFLKIQNSQGIEAVQILALSIFCIAILIWGKKKHQLNGFIFDKTAFSLAAVAAAVLAAPWVWVGALGSPIDLALNLLASLLLGLGMGLLFQIHSIGRAHNQDGTYRTRDLLLDAWTIQMTLFIVICAFSQSMNQAILLVVVLLIGLPALIFARSGIRNESEPGSRWLVSGLFIGLAVSFPTIWIDGDEMALVTSLGQGELIEWVVKACAASLIIGLLLQIMGVVIRKWIEKKHTKTIPIYFTVAVLWIGLVILFFTVGRPGFYGERLFVILKGQADVSNAAQIQDYNQRRETVYRSLTSFADNSQSDLRKSLNRLGIHYKPYYLDNALEVEGGPLVRIWLQSRPEVDRVLESPHLRPLPAKLPSSSGSQQAPQQPQWNLTLIGADKVWSDFGVTGKGIIVGQSDSGVQGDHPELADSYRGNTGQNDYNWLDPWYQSSAPQDFNGHGTHTLGSILGKSVGVAPGATWIGCVNLARNLGNPAFYLDCMQFMLAPYPQNGDPFKDGDPSKGAMVLNNSWGCPDVEGCDPNVFLPAVKALKSAGIFVVVSAGNSGYRGCGSVADPPAIYQQVFSVGAVDSRGNLAPFSSLGPVYADGSQRVKPDILAPGVDVLSAFPHSTYEVESGTSMAGPHIVGVVALIWSANPNLIGNIDQTTKILEQTATVYTGSLPGCAGSNQVPNNAAGYGMVDAYAAVKEAIRESKP